MNLYIIFFILFIVSSVCATIIIFLLIKQKFFRLNYKTINIFLAPFLFGALAFISQEKTDIVIKEEQPKNSNQAIEELRPITIDPNALFALEIASTYNIYEKIDTAVEFSIKKNENITKILKPYGFTEKKIF